MKRTTSLMTLLALSIGVFGQEFYDIENIQKIEIIFVESNWDALLDAEKAGDENYIMAQSVTINGEKYDSVGVKYKGNSTYRDNQTKNPFHIELDTYKDQEYDGYTDIKLSNVAKDPSFLREVLSYKILRNYMDAPLSNFANVYVNGSLLGLYSNSESVSKKFVKSRFGSKSNAFVKCNPPAGAGPGSSDLPDLVYLGEDSTLYYDGYELKSDFGWSELIELCYTLENDLKSIEEILDVDRALWMLAFDNILVNLDSYIGGFQQNYYLYRDDNGRFIPIVWDLNESFGTFSMTGSGNLNSTISKQQMSHILHSSDSDFPLVSKLLSIPTYKRMYLAHCKTILEDNFASSDQYEADAKELQTLIDADVQADQNKFYTYTNFQDNLTSDVNGGGGGPGGSSTPGITNLMDGRYTFLMGQSDFSAAQPSIEQIQLSEDNPFIDDEITITATIQDESSAYLRYRSQPNAPFETVEMFDDGNHNDGGANDDVYGAALPIETGLIEYYLYAENSTIGAFSPTNAAHNFYSLRGTRKSIGDVVINEFLASNDTTQMDQDDEYDDWIELYNKGTEEVDLSGYHLSDDEDELDVFTFPNGTTLQPDSYLIVWADDDEEQEGFHAEFKLSSDGETVYLSDSTMVVLDEVTFSEQASDISYGRYPNGTGAFDVMPPSFSAVNFEPLTSISDPMSVLESLEVYPNPAHENFNVAVSNPTQKRTPIMIFNLQGNVVFSGMIYENLTIDAQDWKAGLYIVKADNKITKLVLF